MSFVPTVPASGTVYSVHGRIQLPSPLTSYTFDHLLVHRQAAVSFISAVQRDRGGTMDISDTSVRVLIDLCEGAVEVHDIDLVWMVLKLLIDIPWAIKHRDGGVGVDVMLMVCELCLVFMAGADPQIHRFVNRLHHNPAFPATDAMNISLLRAVYDLRNWIKDQETRHPTLTRGNWRAHEKPVTRTDLELMFPEPSSSSRSQLRLARAASLSPVETHMPQLPAEQPSLGPSRGAASRQVELGYKSTPRQLRYFGSPTERVSNSGDTGRSSRKRRDYGERYSPPQGSNGVRCPDNGDDGSPGPMYGYEDDEACPAPRGLHSPARFRSGRHGHDELDDAADVQGPDYQAPAGRLDSELNAADVENLSSSGSVESSENSNGDDGDSDRRDSYSSQWHGEHCYRCYMTAQIMHLETIDPELYHDVTSVPDNGSGSDLDSNGEKGMHGPDRSRSRSGSASACARAAPPPTGEHRLALRTPHTPIAIRRGRPLPAAVHTGPGSSCVSPVFWPRDDTTVAVRLATPSVVVAALAVASADAVRDGEGQTETETKVHSLVDYVSSASASASALARTPLAISCPAQESPIWASASHDTRLRRVSPPAWHSRSHPSESTIWSPPCPEVQQPAWSVPPPRGRWWNSTPLAPTLPSVPLPSPLALPKPQALAPPSRAPAPSQAHANTPFLPICDSPVPTNDSGRSQDLNSLSAIRQFCMDRVNAKARTERLLAWRSGLGAALPLWPSGTHPHAHGDSEHGRGGRHQALYGHRAPVSNAITRVFVLEPMPPPHSHPRRFPVPGVAPTLAPGPTPFMVPLSAQIETYGVRVVDAATSPLLPSLRLCLRPETSGADLQEVPIPTNALSFNTGIKRERSPDLESRGSRARQREVSTPRRTPIFEATSGIFPSMDTPVATRSGTPERKPTSADLAAATPAPASPGPARKRARRHSTVSIKQEWITPPPNSLPALPSPPPLALVQSQALSPQTPTRATIFVERSPRRLRPLPHRLGRPRA